MRRLFLYLLQNLRPTAGGLDQNQAVVVRAYSSQDARTLAESSLHGDEPEGLWLDSRQSSLRKIGEVTPGCSRRRGVVIRDFHAG